MPPKPAGSNPNLYKVEIQSLQQSLKQLTEWYNQRGRESTMRQLQTRMKRLQEITQSFNEAQATWERLLASAEPFEQVPLDEARSIRLAMELEIDDLDGNIATLIDKHMEAVREQDRAREAEAGQNGPQLTAATGQQCLKLEALKIPVFDGENRLKYESWLEEWKVTAQLLGDNEQLKFRYLRNTALKGKALETIAGIDPSPTAYATALATLKTKYEDKRSLVHDHLRALFDLPAIDCKSSEAIRHFIDQTRAHLRSLRGYQRPTDQWDDVLLFHLTRKFDRELLLAWEKESKKEDFPTFEQFLTFLEERCLAIERLPDYLGKVSKEKNARSKSSSSARSSTSATMLAAEERVCDKCRTPGHYLARCPQFAALNHEEKRAFLRNNGNCFNCLGKHRVGNCPSKWSCRRCHQRHHTLLHTDGGAAPPPTAAPSATDSGTNNSTSGVNNQPPPSSNSNSVLLADGGATTRRASQPLLTTAVILAKNKQGNFVKIRCLLDNGASLHLASSRLQQILGLSTTNDVRRITGIDNVTLESKRRVSLFIRSRVTDFHAEIDAHLVPAIPGRYPSCPIDTASWIVPVEYELADPEFHRPARVDLIIGVSLFFELLGAQRIRLPNGPMLQESRFGWLLAGDAPLAAANNFVGLLSEAPQEGDHEETSLDSLLERFWQLEEVQNAPAASFTAAEEECEDFFLATTTRNDNGRFQVRLPFRRPPSLLGDSKMGAIRQFLRLEKRLTTEQRAAYAAVIDEHLQLGHLLPIDEADIGLQSYFLPHHAVVRPGASSTKVRVVFNASARSSSGVSLNDVLHKGRKILSDLVPILIRARLRRYLLSCDVTKMYMQVAVHPDDTRYQLIVWRPDPHGPLRFYKFVRVVFGVATAPYLACRSLLLLAETEKTRYPLAAAAIETQTYMDNMLAACSTIEEAVTLRKEMTELLSSACMPLHKWFASDERILEDLKAEDRETWIKLSDGSDAVKALGSVVSSQDEYRFHISIPEIPTVTKRALLSAFARMFDPLGLVQPCVVFVKLLVQDLWRLNCEWDEDAPLEVAAKWRKFAEQLPKLQEHFAVPRFAGLESPAKPIELHLFCDASKRAYGAVAYLRCVPHEGEPVVRLLYAKSKLAPLGKREMSIPRLELCGAKLAAGMATYLLGVMDVHIPVVCFWTDSQDVLWWLRRTAGHWTDRFIANRVAHIQERTDRSAWRHIPGVLNPADHISRGLLPEKLLAAPEWVNGPDFLRQEESEWPLNPISMEADEGDLALVATPAPKPTDVIAESKFANSYRKLRRVGAFIARFLARSKIRSTAEKRASRRLRCPPQYAPDPLSAADLIAGRNIIVILVQRVAFRNEIRALELKQNVPAKSPLRNLDPFLDGALLRVGGRLENANLPFDEKCPLALPSRHPLSKAIAVHLHHELLHSGPTNVLAAIRREFWPLQGRRLVQTVKHECYTCFRAKPRMVEQKMGSLPPARVNAPPFAFHETGVDYCGPFVLTERIRKRPPKKIYVAVFVCLATRAVTLEMVEELSTVAFLQTLANVINRRGSIATLHSDNMKGFTGAAAELGRFMASLPQHQDVQKNLAERGIQWQFIPPRAPHQGGLWEAAVKQFKLHFKPAVGAHLLTWPEMHSLLLRIEAIMNSRPLLPLTEDPDSLEVLTPAHFLLGRPQGMPPLPPVNVSSVRLRDRWQIVQAITQDYWKAWSVAYLHQLQPRGKWRHLSENLAIGDLVLISDNERPPLHWSMGRVIGLLPDKKGVVRVVRLKTDSGEFIRDVRQLARLPLPEQTSQEGENV